MKHIYNPQFDTEEGLEAVQRAISNFTEERWLAAVAGRRNLSDEDLLELNAQVVDVTGKLMNELARLRRYAPDFNKQFVTRDNNCFSTARVLLGKIHSGTSLLKKIYERFTPNRKPAAAMASDVRPMLYDRSSMGSAEYTPTLFGDSFPPSVYQLFQSISTFFGYMDQAIQICQSVIDEEMQVRSNAAGCAGLYNSFKDDQYFRIKSFMKQLDIEAEEFSSTCNGAIYLRETTTTIEDFSQQGFHNLLFDEVCTLATKELVEAERRGEFTREELMLFSCDRQKILRVREIIRTLDSYVPDAEKKKRIPADYVACLLLWAKPKEDKLFVEYASRTYKQYGGEKTMPGNSGVNGRKGLMLADDTLLRELSALWDDLNLTTTL